MSQTFLQWVLWGLVMAAYGIYMRKIFARPPQSQQFLRPPKALTIAMATATFLFLVFIVIGFAAPLDVGIIIVCVFLPFAVLGAIVTRGALRASLTLIENGFIYQGIWGSPKQIEWKEVNGVSFNLFTGIKFQTSSQNITVTTALLGIKQFADLIKVKVPSKYISNFAQAMISDIQKRGLKVLF